MRRVLLISIMGGLGMACSKAPTATLTYYKDAKPIIDEKCIGCHVAGGIGPFDLTTYANVKTEGSLILPNVQAKVMPPWMPSDTSPQMQGDRSLSDDQISTLTTWIQQGMQEGNPADAPQEPTPTNPFKASATFQVPQPYTPSTSLGTDDYHCFVLDPQLTADTAVSAFNIVPGDRQIVHHVILYAVTPANQSDLTTLEAGGDGNGYTCFGGPGLTASMVAGWVPGTLATTLPQGTGVTIKAGSKLVMQVHYNLLNAPNPAMPPSDQTSAQLEYVPASSVTEGKFVPLANKTFNIPVGQVQTVTFAVDSSTFALPSGTPFYIYGVTPHMHLHGTDIHVNVTHPDNSQDLLIDVPKWQFQWQELYFFQTYKTEHIGDTLNLSCTFDNTQAHQPYINGVQETAVPLAWGEDTLNEMCLSFVYLSLDPPMQ